MKLLSKILVPTMTMASVATVCSCSLKNLKALDQKYFEIDGTILKDFKAEYKKKDSIEDGKYKLTIFKTITALDNLAFNADVEYNSTDLIQMIDYEPDCACSTFGGSSFGGCVNLETVIFPPKFASFGSNLFLDCSKLTTLDLSNIEGEVTFTEWLAPADKDWAKTGKIIYDGTKPNQVKLALDMLTVINAGGTNHWTLKTK